MYSGSSRRQRSSDHGKLYKIGVFLVFLSFNLQLSCSSHGDHQDDIGGAEDGSSNSNVRTVWIYNYSSSIIGPYGWSYLKVELPPRFSSVSVALATNVDLDEKSLRNYRKDKLPMMCLLEGSPPVPDVSEPALQRLVVDRFDSGSMASMQFTQNSEKCFILQQSIDFTLTNEQIGEGFLYIGAFNGIGAFRTRSKMINRGASYTFSGNITVNGCKDPNTWGQSCDKTLHELPCNQFNPDLLNQESQSPNSAGNCRNSLTSCHKHANNKKLFFLNLRTASEQLTVTSKDIKLNQSILLGEGGTKLICYARNGAIPTADLYDYSSDLSNGSSLVIKLPKIGTWYFLIQVVRNVGLSGGVEEAGEICYSLKWEVLGCPEGKAGPSCSWRRYILEDDYRGLFINTNNRRLHAIDLPLEPLLPNNPTSLIKQEPAGDSTWTYYAMTITHEDAGKNINFKLASNSSIKYEIYARYGGLPSLYTWDYYYATLTNNSSNNNNKVSLFKSYGLSSKQIDLYIIYPQQGIWIFGLRYPNIKNMDTSSTQNNISVSVESCPNGCSGYGQCKDSSCSYCWCDKNHGGFDCSTELVPKAEQKWHAAFLIVSNAVALLPAVCSFWKKSSAEGIVFLASGTSSAVYHACDVGWKCYLPYHSLQFMDFWLSFVAVISTFVYMPDMKETTKRAILTVVWILTALMAIDGPTSSSNITFVVIIGAICLVLGLLIEIITKRNSISKIRQRRSKFRLWFTKIMRSLQKRYNWWFIFLGSIALAFAATTWTLESIGTYWIWHSVWHMAIFGAAFFFICSKKVNVNIGDSDLLKPDIISVDGFQAVPTDQSPETVPLSRALESDLS